tara:strand:+ start:193 stop:354 length:162 start_codon:yes stop_codon:yes gene_type:complete
MINKKVVKKVHVGNCGGKVINTQIRRVNGPTTTWEKAFWCTKCKKEVKPYVPK